MDRKELLVPVDTFGAEITGEQLEFRITSQITTSYTGSKVFFGTIESGRRAVVKVSAREHGAEKEWAGTVRAYTAKLPVPEPIALVETQAGQLGLVTGMVDGKIVYYSPQGEYRYQLGQTIKTMHDTVSVEGKDWVGSGRADFTHYDNRLRDWRQGQIPDIDAKSKAQAILSSLVQPMETHCKSAIPRFNHNDIHDGQVIVKDRKITVIDFEEWIEESSLNDVAYYLFSSIRTGTSNSQFRHFLEGYLGDYDFSEAEKGALMFYLLYISCRAVNYISSRLEKFTEVVSTTHRDVIDYVENEKIWKDY